MAYNKAREERKWRIWKEAEEKQLRSLGVSEDDIEKLRVHDWAIFNLARLRYGLSDRFCLLGSFPNPLENPLTTYNTAQGVFDGVLRKILQKDFLVS